MKLKKIFAASLFTAATIGMGCGPLEPGEEGFAEEAELATETSSAAVTVQYPELGWNLDFVYAGGFIFADKMKLARSWISCTEDTWNDGRTIALDGNGWPRALASGQQAVTMLPVHGDGHYAITWVGK